jgi:hypothetical protein
VTDNNADNNANSPAFPDSEASELGMSKRELAAVIICAGMCADPESNASPSSYASDAVFLADLLFKELAKP